MNTSSSTLLSISISDRTDDPFCRIWFGCGECLQPATVASVADRMNTASPATTQRTSSARATARALCCTCIGAVSLDGLQLSIHTDCETQKCRKTVFDAKAAILTGYFATIAVFVVFFSTGVVWHTLDAIHQWFAEGQYEELANEVSLLSLRNVSAALYTPSNGLFADTLWEPANRTFIAARFHESGLGTSNPALASLVEPLVSTLAVAASFVLEGWMLAILFRRTDAFAFKPFFIALHIIAYLTTGALYPFHVFRFLNEAAFTAIDVMATWSSYSMASMYGSGCTFISFLHEVIDSDKGQGNWMDAVMITAVHFSAVSRSEQMSSNVCSTTPVTVTAIVTILSALLKVLTSFYMCLLECYYGLMMLASMYDAFVDVWRITRHGMLRRFEGEIVENIAHVDS